MADEILSRDQNRVTVLGGVTDDANEFVTMLRVDPTTKRLLVSATVSGNYIMNPMTNTGDMIYSEDDSGTPARLGIGTEGQVLTVSSGIPAWGAVASTALVVGTTEITGGTTTRILYDNAGVVGEYTLTGTGTVVVMKTSPSLLTSLLMDTGFVMNWGSNNVVITHTSGILTMGTGELRVTTVGTNTASVVTVGGAQTLTNKGLTSPTLTSPVLGTPTSGNLANCTFPTLNQNTTGSAATLTATRTIWGQNFNGSANVIGALTAVTDITGGASSMIITAGTGNSRTLTLRTTTSGGTATAAITLNTDQSATFGAGATIAGTLALSANSITMTGSLAATGARVTKGWFTDIESTNMVTIGGTSLLSLTATLTNKRITPRVLSAASYTTDTGSSINGDTLDYFIVTAQTGALKFNNPTGTPTDGQKLIITVASSTTSARALTWDTIYLASTVALPTTTEANTNQLTIGFIYSVGKTKWICVAVA